MSGSMSLFAFVAAALVSATLLAAAPSTQPTAEQTPPAKSTEVKVGDTPELKFTSVNDMGEINLAAYRGKVVLVEFWATWCPLCMDQLGKIMEMQKKYPDQLQVIGVSLDTDKERLLRVAKGRKLSFPINFEGKGWDNPVYNAWYAGRNEGIPRSYVIGPDGKVAFITFSHEGLNQAIEQQVAKVQK